MATLSQISAFVSTTLNALLDNISTSEPAHLSIQAAMASMPSLEIAPAVLILSKLLSMENVYSTNL